MDIYVRKWRKNSGWFFFLKAKKYKHGVIGIQNAWKKNKLSMIIVLKFLNYVGTKLEMELTACDEGQLIWDLLWLSFNKYLNFNYVKYLFIAAPFYL
mgnify:CR=1